MRGTILQRPTRQKPLARLASPTFTGVTTAPEFSASGLTGATSASRYVGATASGAPASGTFAIGDFVVDRTGAIWVCTTAGTPGTWTSAGQSELGYAQVTGNVDVPAVAADVGSLAVTVTVASRPILLAIDAQGAQISTLANVGAANIMEAATVLATAQWGGGPADSVYPLHREVRLAPSPGAHTYKVQVGLVTGSHGADDVIQASATSPFSLSCRQL